MYLKLKLTKCCILFIVEGLGKYTLKSYHINMLLKKVGEPTWQYIQLKKNEDTFEYLLTYFPVLSSFFIHSLNVWSNQKFHMKLNLTYLQLIIGYSQKGYNQFTFPLYFIWYHSMWATLTILPPNNFYIFTSVKLISIYLSIYLYIYIYIYIYGCICTMTDTGMYKDVYVHISYIDIDIWTIFW